MHWPAESLRDITLFLFFSLNLQLSFLVKNVFLSFSQKHVCTHINSSTQAYFFDYKQKSSALLIKNIYTKNNK